MQRFCFTTLLVAAFTGLSLAQAGPYCGLGNDPNPDACARARTAIDPSSSWQTGGNKPVASAGDCSLAVSGEIWGAVWITGQEWLDTLDKLVGVCGYHPGWTIGPNSLNISIYQCRTGGGFGVPDQPCNFATPGIYKRSTQLYDTAMEEAPAVVARETDSASAHHPKMVVRDPYVGGASARAALHALSRRDATPVCTATAGCEIGDCHALAADLRGTSPIVPSTRTHGRCTVALQAKGPAGGTVSGDFIADNVDRGTDYCNSGGYVGDVYINASDSLDIFFGTLCGKFGQGIGQCVP